MALLRAEQIVVAVLAQVTGLTTTGARVHRGRVYALETVPALTLAQGADNPVDTRTGSSTFLDSELDIVITAHVKSSSTQVDTTLNLIRKEVHAALMDDVTQGLSFVYMTIPKGATEPRLAGDAEKPTAAMDMLFTFRYRHNYTDASA